MKLSLLLTFLTLFPLSLSAPGPISPASHPATSLRERIRNLRLSLDRELLTLAQLESSSTPSSLHQTAADTILDEDDGFTEVVNDGTGVFRPILPGVRTPAANEFPDASPMETEDPDETMPPVDPSPVFPGPTRTPEVIPLTPSPGVTITPEIESSPTPLMTIDESPTPVMTIDESPTPFMTIDESPTPIMTIDESPTPFLTVEESPTPGIPEDISPSPIMSEAPVIPFPEFPGELESTPMPEETATMEMEFGISESPDGLDNGAMGGSPEPVEAAATTPPASPTPTQGDDDPVCFPAEATVELEGGVVKRMEEVRLGDRVRVGPQEWSEVFMFTHKLSGVRSRFVRIGTESGHSLELTSGHYLYVNGRVVPARTVKVGDSVMLADHEVTEVKSVGMVEKRGLYNPQTVHGDIVVGGVRATTYTTAVERRMAHALLAPIRAVYTGVGWTWGVFEGGADRLASLVPSGSVV